MANSEKNYDEKFIHSPIANLTERIELNKDLTAHDIVLINRILIGSAKMISTLNDGYLKKMAKRKALFSEYSIGFTYLLAILLTTHRPRFQQSDIRRELSILRKIQPSDVSEYLAMIVRMGIKSTSSKPMAKRGRPLDTGINAAKKPGRHNLSYEDSYYMSAVEKLLSKPIARNLIYCYMFESMLFQKWIYSMVLLNLYRLSYEGPKALLSSPRIVSTPTDNKIMEIVVAKLYRQCKALGDSELLEMAWEGSSKIANSYSDRVEIMRDFFNFTCKLGASSYWYIPVLL